MRHFDKIPFDEWKTQHCGIMGQNKETFTVIEYNIAGEPIPLLKRQEITSKYVDRKIRINAKKQNIKNNEKLLMTKENNINVSDIKVRELKITSPFAMSSTINTKLNPLSKQHKSSEIIFQDPKIKRRRV